MVPTFECQYLDVITGWWVWSDYHTGSIGGPLRRIKPHQTTTRIRNMQQGKKKRKQGRKKASGTGWAPAIVLWAARSIILQNPHLHQCLISALLFTGLMCLCFRVPDFLLMCCGMKFYFHDSLPLKSKTVNSSSKSKRPKGYSFFFFIIL